MSRMMAAGLLSWLWLAPAATLHAAFSVRTEVDAHKIGVQDTLQLTITLEGSGAPDEIELPPLSNLELAGGPAQSTQVSIVNGRMSQSRSLTYVLRPRAVGKAEIGALTVGDQTAPAIPLEVVAGSVRPREAPRRADPFGVGPFGGDPFGDPLEELFGRRARGRVAEPKLQVSVQPSKTRLHVGEPLVLTYLVDTQVAIGGVDQKVAPQYAGFWVEDLERQATPEIVTIEGERFQRLPFLTKLLFPAKAGVLTLPPASFRFSVARQSVFDSGGLVERSTKPVVVTVDPLPDRPGFSGAVGRFEVSASLDRDVVPLGEAATLRVRLEGTGNLKWIDKGPDVTASGAKVYPPQAKSELRSTPAGIAGARTWEFVVVPETAGTVGIPALPFSWFDPASDAIVTRQTQPLSLRVEGGTAAALPPSSSPSTRTYGSLPLRSELDASPVRFALDGRALVILASLVLLIHGGLLASDRLRHALPGSERRLPAGRSVRSALRHLERVASGSSTKEAAAALIEKALHEAFGEVAEGDESERARAVRGVLDDVRFLRYAPQLGDYSDKIRALAADAAGVVRRWA